MNKLNEILGTEFPIIQGGMANIATGEFAAACSNAGALGVIATGGMLKAGLLREQIHICKRLTDRPFGVNLMLMNPCADEMAQIIIDEGVKVVTTGAGSPGKYIPAWKAAGVKVLPVVAAAVLAKRLVRAGADAIIAEEKSQADKLRDDDRAEIEVFKNSAQLSAQQAKRDAVLAFRQEVQQEFEKILAADVGKALDQQTLAKLIQAALQGEDVSGYAVEVGQVTDGIRQQLAQELKNGLELRPSKKVGAGFRLAAKDGSGYFDCSDQEIAEMLMPFFRDMHL